jgi:hypothetical protein
LDVTPLILINRAQEIIKKCRLLWLKRGGLTDGRKQDLLSFRRFSFLLKPLGGIGHSLKREWLSRQPSRDKKEKEYLSNPHLNSPLETEIDQQLRGFCTNGGRTPMHRGRFSSHLYLGTHPLEISRDRLLHTFLN